MENNNNFNRLLIHDEFNETISDMNKIKISLPVPSQVFLDLQNFIFPPNGELVAPVEDISAFQLDPKRGQELFINYRNIVAYDESINKFQALEGTAYLASHSLILVGDNDFIPMNLITLYFYTRSKSITGNSNKIKYSLDPDMDSKRDFIVDKINFLLNNAPKGSLLFIDGPLIGGDVYTYMIKAIEQFNDNDIIPIFFVKNSSSNLVTDNVNEFIGRYNSDMHWAFDYLKSGYRTNFFSYVDKKNKKNAKMFCYLKSHNVSPQRVEFHISTFEKYKDDIPAIMDLIQYLVLVQGNIKNPQIRPIVIAEKYARATLGLIDFNKTMNNLGITPTMNQERFAW